MQKVKNNRFVFVAPMFNASQTLGTMLHSICGQSYDNWRLELIDDCSSEEHKLASYVLINQFQALHNNKINVVWNTDKKWEVANVLDGLSRCENDDIVCRIDADDWLVDLDALMIINYAYNNTGCDTLWTAHRWGFSDKNISAAMPNDVNPYKFNWVSSHLKTFRKNLLNDVHDINFRGPDGEYVRRAGDQAIYLPALHNSKNRFFLPRVMYHYTINDVPETYQSNDAFFQRDEAIFLRERGFIK